MHKNQVKIVPVNNKTEKRNIIIRDELNEAE